MKSPITYKQLVAQLKAEIQAARIKASLSSNVQMLVLYWKMGWAILQNQRAEGWGAKIIDNLAKDLRNEFPDMKGISPRNLKYTRAFAGAYPQFVQQAAALSDKTIPQVAGQSGNKLLVNCQTVKFCKSHLQKRARSKFCSSLLQN